MSLRLDLAHCVPCTQCEGPGRRFALWVRGCSLRCPGCCNPELFDRGKAPGEKVSTLLRRIEEASRAHRLEGISVLGGEPLEQLASVAALCRGARDLGLGVIVFSGYTLSEARERPGFETLWSSVDTLVDGRFEAARLERREPQARAYLGSTNQGLRHRSSRYEDPELWQAPARAEVQISPSGQLSVHGEPEMARRLSLALRP